MNEEYKVDLSVEDADEEFVIDEASGTYCLEQINLPTSHYLDEAGVPVLRASSFNQPTLFSDLCASGTVASLAGGLGTIAESVKPLSALGAMKGIISASSLLQDFACPTPALGDVLKSNCAAAVGVSALTDQFSVSLPDTSSLGASFGNAIKVAIPEPVPFVAPVPVVEAIGEVQGVSSLAESTQQILSANAEVFGEMQTITRAATDAIRSAFTEIVAPITESLRKISEGISEVISPIVKIGNFIKDLFVSIKVPDFVSGFFDRMHEAASLFSEMLNNHWQDIAAGLCGLTHMMLLRIMRKKRKKNPPLPALSWRESIKVIASRVQVGLSRPVRIREFVASRRHTLLHKYQRVSEDSDDMNDVVFLPFAA